MLPVIPRLAFGDDKKPISFWYEAASADQQQQVEKLLVAPFNAAHPEDDLSVDFRGADLDKQLRIAMLSGSGPDIVYTGGPAFIAAEASAGQLLDLGPLAQKLGWEDRVLPVFLELGKYGGKLYALAKTYETLGLFYNKTVFDKNGWQVPTTIDEFEQVADAAKAKGLVPLGAGNSDLRATNEIYVSIALNAVAGADVLYKVLTGALPWTDPAMVAAIDRMKAWWDKGYYGPNYLSITGEQGFAQMAAGQAAMASTGTWAFQWFNYLKQSSMEAGFAGFPSLKGDPAFPLGVGSTFSINAQSANIDGAAAVLDMIFTPKFYAEMGSVWPGEWNLPLKDLSGVELTGVPPLYTEVMKNLAAAVAKGQYGYTSYTFMPPATDDYLISGIEDVWLGRTSSKDYLAKLDETFKREKSQGKAPSMPARG
jgi:raffinose/stachyose/melibiose transport system substrate-binding protein